MRILADENIPLVHDMLSPCGEVVTIHGREISTASLKGFDALLVRSITKVNADLLTGSKIRFVGTATAGTDHIDKKWLYENEISFADATGSNANSVAEYVIALILKFCVEKGISAAGKSVGIIGIGNIGSRVALMASALGMKILLNDPPLADIGIDGDWKKLDELYQCDFLTIHVPLTKEGPYRTRHLFSAENMALLKSDLFFINAARGDIVNNADLLAALNSGKLKYSALDVWENEPRISIPLLEKVYHATPHIAGYSFDAKINGTIMLYKALKEHFEIKSALNPESFRPTVVSPEIRFDNTSLSHEESLLKITNSAHNFNKDTINMQMMRLETTPADQGRIFDKLRKEYPIRREFSNYSVRLIKSDSALTLKLNALGFRTAS